MIRANEFCEINNISKNYIHVLIHQNSLSHKATVRKGRSVYVDEDYFIKRKQLHYDIWNECHDMYFFITKTMSQSTLASILAFLEDCDNYTDNCRKIASWNSWLTECLFSIPNGSIVNYKVGDNLWFFYRACKLMINRMFRMVGVPRQKRDLLKVWEKDNDK